MPFTVANVCVCHAFPWEHRACDWASPLGFLPQAGICISIFLTPWGGPGSPNCRVMSCAKTQILVTQIGSGQVGFKCRPCAPEWPLHGHGHGDMGTQGQKDDFAAEDVHCPQAETAL